ncbi:leucine-rich repeat domain-containing protein [Neisseria sp. 23W00296]|uniref:leucine-rich repeat domain-containing protein n=1 Tax=unclassified Neisseria TaxID=2623750 RepID=UPI000346FF5A|nr:MULTISPECIES: hypothetical protein [unclassified Neisseria]ASP18281.1 hypothetical protein CGZ77_11470 [Neisseria sp. KEM232]
MGSYITYQESIDLSDAEFSEQEFAEWETQLAECAYVQTARSLAKIGADNLKKLNERIFAKHPHIALRLYWQKKPNLTLLRHLPDLQNLWVENDNEHPATHLEALARLPKLKSLVLTADGLDNLDFLQHVSPDLEKLLLRCDYHKAKFNLAPVARLQKLKFLSIGNCEKGLPELIPRLPGLETLHLRSISNKISNLDFLAQSEKLQSLTLQLCGVGNLDALARLPRLRYVQLWRTPKISSLSPIAALPNLQYLFIETMNGISALPDFSRAAKLRRIDIVACKNITDFRGLQHAPALRQLLIENNNFTPPDIQIYTPSLQNPTLQRADIFCEQKRTREALAALTAQYGKDKGGRLYYCGEFAFED